MAVSERERNALHNRLTEVLGEDAAVTLMHHLPPTGWGDVATKQDLYALEERLESKMDIRIAGLEGKYGGLEGKIGGLEGKIAEVETHLLREMVRQTRVFIFAMLTAVVTTAGIAFGAAGLS